MAIKYVVVHRTDKNNIGDMASNPLQYYLPASDYQVVDILDIGASKYPSDVPLIAGGGGLIGNQFLGSDLSYALNNSDQNALMTMWKEAWSVVNHNNIDVRDEFLRKLQPMIKEYIDKLDNTTAPRIVWGAGHNEDTNKRVKRPEWPDWLSNFDLIGVRDHGQPYEWVPCASCLDTAFDKNYRIKNDVIWYEHKKQLIKSTHFGSKPVPRYINSGANMEQTIELLGSANTIITNSYHGAYLGTLLGKKVIVAGAWSSKFHTLKHRVTFINPQDNYEYLLDNVETHPESLQECREANNTHWNKIRSL